LIDKQKCFVFLKVNPFDTTADSDICMAISNANGHQPSLFVPEVSFHQLVKQQISRLERPALETVEAVKAEMVKLAGKCADMSQVRKTGAMSSNKQKAWQYMQWCVCGVRVVCGRGVCECISNGGWWV
jgi:hypothetical protein